MIVNYIFLVVLFVLFYSTAMSISHGNKSVVDIETQYVTYPEELNYSCLACGSPVEYCYPSGGHTYTCFFGKKVKEFRKFYRCTNSNCDLFNKPLNPAPFTVLPHKQYSLAVWKWIAKEAKIYGQKTAQICKRIQKEFGVGISEGTIRNYLNEIDAFLSNQIDKKTHEKVKDQGKIILALDGQKPDKDGDALWLFVDLLSNRVVDICILSSADHLTLHSIVEKILKNYEVELKGLVSDKQNSIVKMRDKFYPDVPHQYCHFHFLRNLWKHIEAKDDNLHAKLKKAVNNLYILTASSSSTIHFEGLGKASIREVFEEVEIALRALVRAQTRKFTRLRGIKVHERLSKYVGQMENILAEEEDPGRKVVELMKRTAESLRNALEGLKSQYEDCVELNGLFQEIRKALGKEPEERKNLAEVKRAKKDVLDAKFKKIWRRVKGKFGIDEKSELRSFQPKKDTPRDKIKQEWVRLYHTHRRGLYSYYDLPIAAKTNSPMEGKFSLEKSLFISRVGKQRAGSQVRVRGASVLKQLYVGEKEVEEHIWALGHEYDREQVKKGLESLSRRIHEETKHWKDKMNPPAGLRTVLRKGKKGKKDETQ